MQSWMRTIATILVLVVVAISQAACRNDGVGSEGEEVGGATEGADVFTELELVTPGVISTEGGEAFPSVSPDGGKLYFAKHGPGWTDFTLYVAGRAEGGWGQPERLPFSGEYNDRAPFPSLDGSSLYFSSDRPLPGSDAGGTDFNVWVVRRDEAGVWSEPEPVAGVNSEANDFHAAITRDGVLFFSSNRPGGLGTYDLYRAAPDGDGYGPPENLGPPINTPGEETDVYVDPDGTFLIVVATDREGGRGADDLWLSVRGEEGWGELENLYGPVNSTASEYGPFITPNRQYLLFTTHRRGLGDIVRRQIASIPALARVALK
jgi:hypothetical protein